MSKYWSFENFTKEEIVDEFIFLTGVLDYESKSREELIRFFNEFLQLAGIDYEKTLQQMLKMGKELLDQKEQEIDFDAPPIVANETDEDGFIFV